MAFLLGSKLAKTSEFCFCTYNVKKQTNSTYNPYFKKRKLPTLYLVPVITPYTHF